MDTQDPTPGHSLPKLVKVMKRLLAPDGCPWDQEQTLASLKPYLIEETYEVLEALETGTPTDHCEELGDLLLQIVFQAELQSQDNQFSIDDVVEAIVTKLVRRHPHVFADSDAKTSDEVATQWTEIKRQERAADPNKSTGVLAGIPVHLPALARAKALSTRAADVGFDWPDIKGSRAKVEEELEELDDAISTEVADEQAAELGDLLFAVVNLARKLGTDPETCLRGANQRFSRRFHHIEAALAAEGKAPQEVSLEALDKLWDKAKIATRGQD